MLLSSIKKKIDNLANKLNKRFASYSKLSQLIPEVKHALDVLTDPIFHKFVKNGKLKRGVSDLTEDEQIEYLEQLEQIEGYTPTRKEAQQIIDETISEFEEIGYDVDEDFLLGIADAWQYIKDNIPSWVIFFTSTEMNDALEFVATHNGKRNAKEKLQQIKSIIEGGYNDRQSTRYEVFDILYEEQTFY